MNIVDEYTSFCFDEACAYILGEIKEGNEPTFTIKYNSFKDLYKMYE